jgi:hypothetical protein
MAYQKFQRQEVLGRKLETGLNKITIRLTWTATTSGMDRFL